MQCFLPRKVNRDGERLAVLHVGIVRECSYPTCLTGEQLPTFVAAEGIIRIHTAAYCHVGTDESKCFDSVGNRQAAYGTRLQRPDASQERMLPPPTLFDSHEPISEPCARTVEPAVAALLGLGIIQQEVIEHVSRALGIVRCVLDYQQPIPRRDLAAVARALWSRLPQIPDISPDLAQQVRAIILDCVHQLRQLSDNGRTEPAAQRRNPPLPRSVLLPEAPRTASPVPHLTSIHSTPDRGPYGDALYPGNCSGLFIKDLLRFFGSKTVFDPMTGGGTCKDVCRELGIKCESTDLRGGMDACDPARYVGTGPFDFVWLHPPYWRQKRYSDDPRCLSNASTLDAFLEQLRQVVRNCAKVLCADGKLAILIGNYHDRKAGYVPLVYHAQHACRQVGLRHACTEIIRLQHGASSSGKVYRSKFIPMLHEVCVIWERVDESSKSRVESQ